VQQAFLEADALQCGWCTPGMIMGAVGVLKRFPNASEADIVKAWTAIYAAAGLTRA